MAKQTIEVVVQDKTARALGNINNRVNGLSRSFGNVTKAAGAFVAVLGAREVIQFGARIKDTTAEFQNYRNQLRLITDGTEDLNRVFNLLTQTAKDNRTSFGETVDLFTKLRISTEALGIAEERVIDVTSKLSQALQVAGADGNTAASVIRQFGQAMASGEVRGDEFRSLVEGLGPALAIMARESGITVGELRKMSQAGELTAQTMFELLENSNSLTAAFQSMDPTISQLETGLSDAFDRALVKLGEVSGFTTRYEKQIQDLTRTFDNFAGQNRLATMSIDDLMNAVTEGTVGSEQAAQELIARYRDLSNEIRIFGHTIDLDLNIADALGVEDDDQKRAIANAVNQIRELGKQLEEQAKATEAATKAEQERIDALNNIIRPFQEYINLGDRFIKQDFGTPLEKANAQLARAQEALSKLREAQAALDESGMNSDNYHDLAEQITATAEAVAHFQSEVDELSKTPYQEFLEGVLERSRDIIQETEFTTRAISELGDQLEAGTIDLETYTQALKLLQDEEKDTADTTKELERSIDQLNQKYSEFLGNSVTLANEAAQRDLEKYQEALDQKMISEEEFAAAKIAIQQSLANEILNIERENQKKIDDLYMKSLRNRIEANAKGVNEQLSQQDRQYLQRKGQEERTQDIVNKRIEFEKKSELEKTQFGLDQGAKFFQGLSAYNKKFFAAYKAFAIAQAIINTYQGATKALATYPPPFNFIAAAATVASGLAQVATIRAQTAQRGGNLITGGPALVGEDGPELIVPKQPSTVIPREVADAVEGLGGANNAPVNVNFNITTTDAKGFDSLLVERRSTIVGIINQAMNTRGKTGVTV